MAASSQFRLNVGLALAMMDVEHQNQPLLIDMDSKYKEPHSYCHFCGCKYIGENAATWPRKCSWYVCSKTVWKNPLPVVVALIPVMPGTLSNPGPVIFHPETFIPVNVGVLAVRRAIPPDVGKLALPSGYVDDLEDWREAAMRELEEETELSFKEDDLELFDVVASKNKKHTLIIFETKPIFREEISFVMNDEVIEIVVVKDPTELVWDVHQLMTKRLFKTL